MIRKANSLEGKFTTMEDVRNEVLALLGWDEDRYGMYVFETGILYLALYFGREVTESGRIALRKEFWNWWKNHWCHRDQLFLELVMDCPQFGREEFYHNCHNAKMLAAEIHPNRVVLGPDFHIVKMKL